jgi:hypothetical protein
MVRGRSSCLRAIPGSGDSHMTQGHTSELTRLLSGELKEPEYQTVSAQQANEQSEAPQSVKLWFDPLRSVLQTAARCDRLTGDF